MAFYNILHLGKAIITSFKDNSFRKNAKRKTDSWQQKTTN